MASFAFPFSSTFRRLELERRWWHRLCVVLFFVVLLVVAAFASVVSYGAFAPQIQAMPDIHTCDIFDQVAAQQQHQSEPDGGCLDEGLPKGAVITPITPSGSVSEWDAQGNPIPQPPSGSVVALKKAVEMPDGSTSLFADDMSDDAVKALWNKTKAHQTLKAIAWAALIAVGVLLFFNYLLQIAYRALLYVIFGKATQAA